MFHRVHLQEQPDYVVLQDLLYAGDIILLSTSQGNSQRELDEVTTESSECELELNWNRTFQMNVGTNIEVYCPGGAQAGIKRNCMYLGGLIICDGRCEGALNTKLSEGRSIFRGLCQTCSHASLGEYNKLVISECSRSFVFKYSLGTLAALSGYRWDR